MINQSVDTNTFPDALKLADVVPVYKKEDPLDKKNYRPVSVLPCLSKLFERVLLEQINVFFESVSSKYLSCFRKGHCCQSVLLNLVEKCKLAIDYNHVYGILLKDLHYTQKIKDIKYP